MPQTTDLEKGSCPKCQLVHIESPRSTTFREQNKRNVQKVREGGRWSIFLKIEKMFVPISHFLMPSDFLQFW